MSEKELEKIEKSFEETTRVILGAPLKGMRNYESWLSKHVKGIDSVQSAVSKETVYIPPIPLYSRIKGKFVKLAESFGLDKLKLEEKEVEELTLLNAVEKLKKISYTTPELVEGTNAAMNESTVYADASYAFRTSEAVGSKYTAYCFWPRNSEYVYGSSTLFSSKFCIKCYDSTNLARCFEVGNSANCRDSYFCHNCEGLTECMFCFNVKSKRYAIGNVEIGKESYEKIKKLVLEEIAGKLEKDKTLDVDIFNVGVYGSENKKEKNVKRQVY
ncbi:MAG: hypothetical protein ABIH99_01895 [Candidatus Micrarchaeota archaeon]